MTGRNIEEIEKDIRQNLQPKKLKVDAACSPVKFPDQPKSKKRSINEILIEE